MSNDVLQVTEFEQEKKDMKESSTPPQVEMKSLPSHLEYAFVGDDSTYLIMVSSELNGSVLDRLVSLVKKHRKAIGVHN